MRVRVFGFYVAPKDTVEYATLVASRLDKIRLKGGREHESVAPERACVCPVAM